MGIDVAQALGGVHHQNAHAVPQLSIATEDGAIVGHEHVAPRDLVTDEMVDIGKDGIDTGAKLRMVFRIKEKDRQRGYNRYFWKSTPLSAA